MAFATSIACASRPLPVGSGSTVLHSAKVVAPNVSRIIERTGSGIALARLGGTLVAYVADEDDRRILTVDVDAGSVIGEFELGGIPGQLVTLPNARVAVTLRDRSRVVLLEGAGTTAAPFLATKSFDVPTEPIGVALTPDDASLVVTSGWGRSLAVLALDGKRETFTTPLGREPRGVTVSHDGRRAFVTHAIGEGLSIVKLDEPSAKPKVWFLDAESWVPGFRGAPDGPFPRKAMQGYAVAVSDAPSGRVFVPHVLVHTALGMDPTSFGRTEVSGYGNADAGPPDVFDVAIVDELTGTPIDFAPNPNEKRVRLATATTSCLLPRAAVTKGLSVFITCLDSDRVLELDAASMAPQRVELRSWQVPRGPTALAVDRDGQRMLVWSTFARKLTSLALVENADALPLASIHLEAKSALEPLLARGRELFHSGEARISSDHRTCSSCHPDGRDDGLVWATPDGPRQTPMLAGRLEGAAPYGWTGSAPDIAAHVPKTFARLGGKGLVGEDKEALLAYVRSLSAPSVRPTENADWELGKAIFHSSKAACASCHGVHGELPDGERHNVKSWAAGDITGSFDTPSLKFVGQTGPWFHDGRYRSLHELLVRADGKMGSTKHLSPQELDALETYVRSL